ncbi:hypothetical protein VNO77_24626 [Canavalia gladiata]|uniref:Uncharacterized protein n=1 Tax=Canavalia gladiata TaxID=3824 RepID=A0AAN9L6M6_CANGL
MTGEMMLRDLVLPVGGVKDKHYLSSGCYSELFTCSSSALISFGKRSVYSIGINMQKMGVFSALRRRKI